MTAPNDPYSAPPPSADQPGSGTAQAYGTAPQGYGTAPQGYGAAPAYGAPPSSPFGQPGGPQLAGWGIRAGGYLIDTIISGAIILVLQQISPALSNVASLAIGIAFGYITGTTGQTPGRRLVGIKVLREADGQYLGAGAGIGRQFLHILDALPLLLGFFWPIWDAKKQTFADKIIKSVVVKV